MRVRGLKPERSYQFLVKQGSHPMRVRGLKLSPATKIQKKIIAPHAGAWIETLSRRRRRGKQYRTPCGCVDWNLPKIDASLICKIAPHAGAWIETFSQRNIWANWHRTPCGCVDWNTCLIIISQKCVIAPHAGAWIETLLARKSDNIAIIAPHAGAWIETSCGHGHRLRYHRTPCGCVDWNRTIFL